jgi:peptidoglycan hydrolase-like protein with peptidoglycan-binding domain
VSDGHMEWREVLCETNLDHATIRDIQRALAAAGHDPGPIDGIVGRLTLAAVADYQREKGLPVGGLTIETIEGLGLNPR